MIDKHLRSKTMYRSVKYVIRKKSASNIFCRSTQKFNLQHDSRLFTENNLRKEQHFQKENRNISKQMFLKPHPNSNVLILRNRGFQNYSTNENRWCTLSRLLEETEEATNQCIIGLKKGNLQLTYLKEEFQNIKENVNISCVKIEKDVREKLEELKTVLDTNKIKEYEKNLSVKLTISGLLKTFENFKEIFKNNEKTCQMFEEMMINEDQSKLFDKFDQMNN